MTEPPPELIVMFCVGWVVFITGALIVALMLAEPTACSVCPGAVY